MYDATDYCGKADINILKKYIMYLRLAEYKYQ